MHTNTNKQVKTELICMNTVNDSILHVDSVYEDSSRSDLLDVCILR